MAKQSYASMSVQALLKLRDDIGAALTRKTNALKAELKSLGSDYSEGRTAVYGRNKARKTKKGHALRGRKVAAKYRDPNTGESWSGRGATAGWLAAHEKAGRKRDQYLIAKPAKKAKRKKR
jgi:DNA-binding protein H-NS